VVSPPLSPASLPLPPSCYIEARGSSAIPPPGFFLAPLSAPTWFTSICFFDRAGGFSPICHHRRRRRDQELKMSSDASKKIRDHASWEIPTKDRFSCYSSSSCPSKTGGPPSLSRAGMDSKHPSLRRASRNFNGHQNIDSNADSPLYGFPRKTIVNSSSLFIEPF